MYFTLLASVLMLTLPHGSMEAAEAGSADPIVLRLVADPMAVDAPGQGVSLQITVENRTDAPLVLRSLTETSVSGSLDGLGTCSVPRVVSPSASYSCDYVTVVGDPEDSVFEATVIARAGSREMVRTASVSTSNPEPESHRHSR